jgi:hypothetical protein
MGQAKSLGRMTNQSCKNQLLNGMILEVVIKDGK